MGYATETLAAVTEAARGIGLTHVYAACHPDNAASSRVLEKCGFVSQEINREHRVFPNLDSKQRVDVLYYVLQDRSAAGPTKR
jgi:RimJ/RimL family protein N-acetyltransferase